VPAAQTAPRLIRRRSDCPPSLGLRLKAGAPGAELDQLVYDIKQGFVGAMDDDLNISVGLAVVFELIKEINALIDSDQLNPEGRDSVLAFLEEINTVLDVFDFEDDVLDDEKILAAIEARIQARKNRDFAEADRIRDDLADKGIILQDSPQGTRWRRK